MAGWSQLTNDVLYMIGERLNVTADRIRFRSVCRAWRSVLPFPQPPWLMLAEDNDTPKTRGFFGLGIQQDGVDGVDQQRVYQFEVPEMCHARSIGSKGTWLITIDLKQRMRLLNPFSRLQFNLPSQRSFENGRDLANKRTPQILRDVFLKKALLSSPPSSGGDCIVMAIHHRSYKLAFARPGDASWTPVQTPRDFFQDVIFYKNQFYAINRHKILVVCQLGETPPTATMLTDVRVDMCLSSIYYLVEWMGELLLVVKVMQDDDKNLSYELGRFEVYKFNFAEKEWITLEDLGEYSLFLGFNTSVAVLASDYPGLNKNCIYFTDDYTWGYQGLDIQGGRCMGVFDLGDSSIHLHYKGTSTSLYSPPLWIIP